VTDEKLAELLAELSPIEKQLLERELEKIPPGEALGLTPTLTRTTTRSRARTCFDFTKVENAVAHLKRLPRAEETIHCLMGGDYNAADLIPAVQSIAGRPVDELHLATLGFNKTNTAQLCAMFDDGLIRRISLACSHYFANTDQPTFEFAAHELRKRGQKIVATRTHAKLALFRFGRDCYAVESSANLRSCNNVEQFSFTRSSRLFRFHRAWLEHIHTEGAK
jgi:hypothetical protein